MTDHVAYFAKPEITAIVSVMCSCYSANCCMLRVLIVCVLAPRSDVWFLEFFSDVKPFIPYEYVGGDGARCCIFSSSDRSGLLPRGFLRGISDAPPPLARSHTVSIE